MASMRSTASHLLLPNARVTQMARQLPAAEALAAMFFVLLIDAPTRMKLGGGSLSAVITVALPILFGALLIINLIVAAGGLDRGSRAAFHAGVAAVPWPLILFAAYATARFAMEPTADGLQNVMCYLMFVLAILLVVTSLRFDYRRVLRLIGWCAILSATMYLIQQTVFFTGPNADRPFIGDRSFAMTSLLGLAVFVPAKRDSNSSSAPHRLLPPFFILAVLVVSLSRTALVVGCVLLLFLAVRARRSLRLPAVIAAVVFVLLSVILVVVLYPPVLNRFTEGDNVDVGGVRVNTSGRSVLWEVTYRSAMRAPIWGHGPGNSKSVIQQEFWLPGTDHPHNDYLRIFNDLGLVGVALFWGGIFYLLIKCWRRARARDEARHWSAVMAVLSVVLLGITDNVIVYQFIMLPVAVLVGISLRPDPGSVPIAVWQWAPTPLEPAYGNDV